MRFAEAKNEVRERAQLPSAYQSMDWPRRTASLAPDPRG